MRFRYKGKERKTDVGAWVPDIAGEDTPCYLFESEAESISFVTYTWLNDETEDQGSSRKKAKETKGKKK